MTRIEPIRLATVVGGLAAVKPIQPATKLIARRVGNTRIINNQSLKDMWAEVKPQ